MVYIHGDIKAALRSSLFDLSWGSVVPVFQSQLRSVLQCILDYVVLTCPLLLSGLSCLSYFVFLQKISVPCSSSNTSCKFQVMHSLPDVTSGVQMRSSSSACWIKAVSPLHLFFLCIFPWYFWLLFFFFVRWWHGQWMSEASLNCQWNSRSKSHTK